MAAALRLGAVFFLLLPGAAAEPSVELAASAASPTAPPEIRAAARARTRSGPAPVTDGGCPVGRCGAGAAAAGHRQLFPGQGKPHSRLLSGFWSSLGPWPSSSSHCSRPGLGQTCGAAALLLPGDLPGLCCRAALSTPL